MMAGVMANSEHLAKLKEGLDAWNAWRKANPEMEPDLAGAGLGGFDLRGLDLMAVDLEGANLIAALLPNSLTEVNFRGADLSMAQFNGANLWRSDLSGANLHNAHLSGAKLFEVNLADAKLHDAFLFNADLTGADLFDADFSRATIGATTFGDNDLSTAKGLETVRHDGPSTIGIDTIYRSQGKIPLTFLRGAGVPENFIEYMSSLTGKTLEFYSCFISYSTKDQEFADRLHADLQNKGVRCWFAPHNVQAGKKLHEQIDVAIRTHEKLLLILSSNSMSSEWVKTEIRKARKRERTEKKRVLFPVRLVSFEAIRDWELFDADEGKDLAVEIREYYIPDFSNWKNHDAYAKELQKLLRDLKTESPKAA